ncbi:protein of unknown function [Pedobacter terrae]|uniref:DUF4886 domain-containing protein n=1 Tax=Pedobacter terrae TaxID=405671 RepID=A0A1G7WV78_9SPHI|nr:DUF4886 domain-containing protein [Pedobacter terrae]SDG75190.1 protein of unknown function [Pedobacter terrae]
MKINMKLQFSTLIKLSMYSLLLVCLAANVFAQSRQDTLRLFIIGNSFSQNASAFLPQLAKERGKTLIIGRAELGGHSLEQHWGYVEKAEANADDPKGKPYGGKSLKMLLGQGKWDMVTIQQYSYLSADSSSYYPYANKLVDYVKALQPQARVVIHQTWAYRTDAKKFGRIAEGKTAMSQQEMWQKSRAAYHLLAKRINARILPVGDAFQIVAEDRKYGFKPDLSFNYEHPTAPNLPDQTHSINIGYYWNKNEVVFDPNHANDAGKYLGGLIWYGILFNDSIKNIRFKPGNVSEEFVQYLRKVADRIILKTN